MEDIREKLKSKIKDLYGLDFEPVVTPAPDNIDADYSTNAPLKLAKEVHKAPMQIAEELAMAFVSIATNEEQLASEPRNDGRERSGEQKPLITPPGFLNFTSSDTSLLDAINQMDSDFKTAIKNDAFTGKTVICEFSDPNPFKVLHVGHLYTSIVGDSISRLFSYAGANVVRANFGGDVGLHVAKTSYALLQKNPDLETLTIEDISKSYIEGTAAYDEDEQAHAEITKLNKEIYQINKDDIHGTPLADLYWRGRELSYDYFKAFYANIGLAFDKYYPESSVAGLGLEKVKEQLAAGVYELSDGAVIFNGDKFGLHTRVFINKEGVPTYEAKDVGLIFTKWADYHFDKSVVITANEQLEYMKVVLKSVEQYAKDLVEKTNHLTHGIVKLPGGVKMSSRKGNFLRAVDVLEAVEEELKNEYNSEDKRVSLAATKYAFLKYKMGGDIIFDPKESVKMTGNSGPYLLYSCVRAKKILEKVTGKLENTDYELEPSTRELLKKILDYKETLKEAVSEMAPHKVANYLYELAQAFSRFYENCPVAGSEHEKERAKFVKVYLDVMTHGLDLLGIEVPEEM